MRTGLSDDLLGTGQEKRGKKESLTLVFFFFSSSWGWYHTSMVRHPQMESLPTAVLSCFLFPVLGSFGYDNYVPIERFAADISEDAGMNHN